MFRKTLVTLIVCAAMLMSAGALADDSRCLPWYDVTWSDAEGGDTISATIYVGVYECSGSLDLTLWPHEVRGTLRPVNESWADALWQKVINDCWSFYGVYPEKISDGQTAEKCVFDLPSGTVTVVRGQGMITILAAHGE